jgi:hypothetical protein
LDCELTPDGGGDAAYLTFPGRADVLHLSISNDSARRIQWAPDYALRKSDPSFGDRLIDLLLTVHYEYQDEDEYDDDDADVG